jgi:hypothetical protein
VTDIAVPLCAGDDTDATLVFHDQFAHPEESESP